MWPGGRRTGQWARRGALTVVVLAAAVAPASAQLQRPHLGGRVGANLDFDEVLLGGHATIPITRWIEFYPSVDVYFPDNGSRYALNADLKAYLPGRSELWWYLGGGLNYLRRNVNDNGDGDVGVNLLGGFETRSGRVHPFVEGRILLHDNTSFQLQGGLNVTLGGH